MASINEDWVITLEPQDVISLSHGLSIDAWPDDDDGAAITINTKAPCDIENADFMAWLENQNWNNLRMLEFLRSWWNAMEAVKGTDHRRKGEMVSAMHDELGTMMHELGMLEDDDVFPV